MSLETRAAFARRIGVNKSTITRAAQSGRIVMVGKKVHIEKSLLRWEQTRGARPDLTAKYDAQRQKALLPIPEVGCGNKNAAEALKIGEKEGVAPNVAEQPSQLANENIKSTGRAHYRAIAMRYENEGIKLKMALQQGVRDPLETVEKEIFALGMALRDSVERMIDQTAPRIAAIKDDAERKQMLQVECAAISKAMKAEFAQALRRIRSSAD